MRMHPNNEPRFAFHSIFTIIIPMVLALVFWPSDLRPSIFDRTAFFSMAIATIANVGVFVRFLLGDFSLRRVAQFNTGLLLITMCLIAGSATLLPGGVHFALYVVVGCTTLIGFAVDCFKKSAAVDKDYKINDAGALCI